ncbi:hypothetical protein [Acetivibrio clariflavus]|uniref:hypothetical protein n=1 Tax=Acetivibrio clariflavus TaxID=288965 RepID=UPI0002DD495E|nr:hypothetical protein [Acetivibrio clariflavus]
MSDSTDELMTCLKREPEALFELVEETKELDNTIFAYVILKVPTISIENSPTLKLKYLM